MYNYNYIVSYLQKKKCHADREILMPKLNKLEHEVGILVPCTTIFSIQYIFIISQF